MKFDVFIARLYLRAKRKQAFIGVISTITLLGITLGVAALNIALAIHNGMRGAFVESLVGKSGQLYVVAGAYAGGGFSEADVAQIFSVLETLPSVAGVSTMRQEQGLAIAGNKRMGYTKLKGIIPEEHIKASQMLEQLEEGDLSHLSKRPQGAYPGIVLGADLADRIGVRRGDWLRVAVPRLASPGLTRQGLRLKEMKCEVVGIFRSGNSQFDEMDAYLHLKDLMRLLNTTQIESILVNFDSIEAMDKGKMRLIASSEMPVAATIVDLRDLNKNLLKALALEKMATTLVILLFILIVGLNMVSALIMLVMEKHRDIGIMKAFGTPKGVILKIFIRQGMTLSLYGTLLGSGLGVGLAWLADTFRWIKLDNRVYEVLNYLPFTVKPVEVVLVAAGSLVLALLSSLYPAQQAATLDPVEALKYD